MALAHSCSPQLIPIPEVFGAQITSFEASLVQNYTVYVPEGVYPNHGTIDVNDLVFCNVTITYIHPGLNQNITTQVWLPTEIWNRRMQGLGGAKWFGQLSPTSLLEMAAAVSEGYIAVTTDGGHTPKTPDENPLDWMLVSPGNVDMGAVRNYASVSLNDAAAFGKSLAEGLYGRRPAYSYWNGCSEGGRQGLALAQKYPDAYDGIVASAPLLPQFAVAGYWPQYVMNHLKTWPLPCELRAITTAVIQACDEQDGRPDGVISKPESCTFEPYHLLGRQIECPDYPTNFTKITFDAIAVASAVWLGAGAISRDDSHFWYGSNRDAPLTGELAPAHTECDEYGRCSGRPIPFYQDWIRLFVKKDPTFDTTRMTPDELRKAFKASIDEYSDILGANNPDLSGFRDRGGKLLMYHGLADTIVPPGSSRRYYDEVTAKDPRVASYFRLFESPGLGHCFGGAGVYPSKIFDVMVAWVEQGRIPNTLDAFGMGGKRSTERLCPYPMKSHDDHRGYFYCSP